MAVMAAEWSMDMKHKKAVAVMSGVVIALGGVYAGAKEANAAEKNVLENSDVINADKMNSDELNYDINNKVIIDDINIQYKPFVKRLSEREQRIQRIVLLRRIPQRKSL